MPTAVSVRSATHTDFSAVAAMLEDFFAQHHRWHPEQFRPRLLGFTPAILQDWISRPTNFNLVAEVEGSAVGFTTGGSFPGVGNDFMFPRPGVFVAFIVVAPTMRRAGIGRALLGAIETWAANKDAEYIGLNVSPLNDDARAFYASLGYDINSEYRTKIIRRVKRFKAAP